MTDAIRTATISRLVEFPLQDEETRKLLIGEGFDLTAPISWRDDAVNTVRYFTQDKGRIVRVQQRT